MSRLLPGSARGSAGALVRRRYLFLPVTAVVLAVALAVTLAPRGLSAADATAAASPAPAAASPAPAVAVTPAAAPNDGDITWTPNGTPVQSDNGSGDCETAMSGTVTGPAAAVAEVDSVLNDEAPDPVNQADIGTVKVLVPAASPGTSMTVYADAGVGCDAINQADAYSRRAGYASPVQFAGAVLGARPGSPAALLAYDLPAWARAAIAAVTVAVVFAAVSVAVTATIAALLTALGQTAFSGAEAALAGCIAGVAAESLGAAIAAGVTDFTVSQSLAVTLGGCFTGGLTTVRVGMTWIASVFQSLGWTGVAAVTALGGEALAADAAAAGAVLEPVRIQLAAMAAAVRG